MLKFEGKIKNLSLRQVQEVFLTRIQELAAQRGTESSNLFLSASQSCLLQETLDVEQKRPISAGICEKKNLQGASYISYLPTFLPKVSFVIIKVPLWLWLFKCILVEHCLHNAGVVGSSPTIATTFIFK